MSSSGEKRTAKDIWGPKIWRLLHTFSAKIKLAADSRNLWKLYLRATVAILPCPVCQDHFSVALRSLNIMTVSTEELELWFFERHNSVNFMNRKPTYSKDDLAVYREPVNKPEFERIIKELADYFIMSEYRNEIPAGTTKIWKGLSQRLLMLCS